MSWRTRVWILLHSPYNRTSHEYNFFWPIREWPLNGSVHWFMHFIYDLQIAMDECDRTINCCCFSSVFVYSSKRFWLWLIVSEFRCTITERERKNKQTEHKLPAPNEHYRMKCICLSNYRRSSNMHTTHSTRWKQWIYSGLYEMQLNLSGRTDWWLNELKFRSGGKREDVKILTDLPKIRFLSIFSDSFLFSAEFVLILVNF